MENDTAIFWFLCITCATVFVMMATRPQLAARGSAFVYGAILLLAVLGRVFQHSWLIYAGGAGWLLFGLLPGVLSKAYYHRFLQQRYASAYRLAKLVSWLHPADGWRQQPQLVRAVEVAQQGDLITAIETLRRFQGVRSIIGISALMNLYRITNQWEELIAWQSAHAAQLNPHPQFLPVLLRARGETGDIRGMIELFDQNHERITRLAPATMRDLSRLVLFAFCGKRPLVEHLFAHSLSLLPLPMQQFWLATADLAAGQTDSGRRQLEQLLPTADPSLRRAIERRLARISIPPQPLDPAAERVIAEAAREHTHDHTFGAQRTLFSKHARATQLLIIVNVVMFGLEMSSGGSENPENLYRLGALFGPSVRAGEWWRLMSSLFLHWGPLHLVMNMFALWILGPFVEFALGFRRFLFVYLLSGIGSMGVVMAVGLARGHGGEQLTVGASGCILGLVGATGALMLRGWLREKAAAARRRLLAMLLIIGMQSVFDSVVPQVSMTAHLSGAVIGFIVSLTLSDRLRSVGPAFAAEN